MASRIMVVTVILAVALGAIYHLNNERDYQLVAVSTTTLPGSC